MGNKFKTTTRRFYHNLPCVSKGKFNIFNQIISCNTFNYLYLEGGQELVQRTSLLGPALTELVTSSKILPVESVTNQGDISLETSSVI